MQNETCETCEPAKHSAWMYFASSPTPSHVSRILFRVYNYLLLLYLAYISSSSVTRMRAPHQSKCMHLLRASTVQPAKGKQHDRRVHRSEAQAGGDTEPLAGPPRLEAGCRGKGKSRAERLARRRRVKLVEPGGAPPLAARIRGKQLCDRVKKNESTMNVVNIQSCKLSIVFPEGELPVIDPDDPRFELVLGSVRIQEPSTPKRLASWVSPRRRRAARQAGRRAWPACVDRGGVYLAGAQGSGACCCPQWSASGCPARQLTNGAR